MIKFSSKSVQLHSKASQGEYSLTSNGAGRHSFARAPIELHTSLLHLTKVCLLTENSVPRWKNAAFHSTESLSRWLLGQIVEGPVAIFWGTYPMHCNGHLATFYSANSDDFCS